ncbi:MAG: hypothetical protein BWY79_02186 [Actinobacteria bacterium ADurb.Bin444]|nr:MAG: hypothetical protein BWY79_02186 [Actinobacteria bacterium ADurb.Bin444]
MDQRAVPGGGPAGGSDGNHIGPTGGRCSSVCSILGDLEGSSRLAAVRLRRTGGLGASAARHVRPAGNLRRRLVEHRRGRADHTGSDLRYLDPSCGPEHRVSAVAGCGALPVGSDGRRRPMGRAGGCAQDLWRCERDLRRSGTQLRGHRINTVVDLRPMETPGSRLHERHRALSSSVLAPHPAGGAAQPVVGGAGRSRRGDHRCSTKPHLRGAQTQSRGQKPQGRIPLGHPHLALHALGLLRVRTARGPGRRPAGDRRIPQAHSVHLQWLWIPRATGGHAGTLPRVVGGTGGPVLRRTQHR